MKCKLFLKSSQTCQKVCLMLLLLLSTLAIHAQETRRVTGIIKDSFNEPLIGVSVTLKGTSTGTVTDMDGKYSLLATANSTLVFSYVGMETQEVQYKDQTEINIKLDDNAKGLDEVIVIGYGTAKRKDVTTAISSVSTEDLAKRPIVSAGQAMQGKAAGVSVIQPSGTPGGEMTIRVRGTSSFNASNTPLYVVDGVPVDNINFLAPNDIQDMQILKDASSAAIYGSRAANGVVLITTKGGKAGDAKITFNTQFGFNRVSEKIKPLNTEQYIDLQKEIGVIGTLPDGLVDQTNWFDEAYSTGFLQSYQASVTDGTEKLRYHLSAGYLDEKGVLNAAYFKRYNFRAKVDNQVRKWLNISTNVSYTDNTRNEINTGTGSNRGGVVLAIINTPTYAPIWNPEKPDQYYNGFYGTNLTHPLENMARNANDKKKENRLLASGSALLTILPELTVKSTFTLDRRNVVDTKFLDPISSAWGRTQRGEGADERNMNSVLTFDNIATYNKSFGKHGFEAMGGTSWTDSDYTNNWVKGSHFRDANIQTLNAANKINWEDTGSGASHWTIMSYLARASYNYDSKYLLTANVRMDGSSKLHPDHRWGTFPSFSAAWRMSSESFMKDISWIDDLKLRGGWGKTGNQSALHDYAYLQRYKIKRLPWFEAEHAQAVPVLNQDSFRAKDLTWETTIQTNVGVDFTALKNRLTINLDYYYKKTTDMLMNVDLPGGQGGGTTNIGRNEGAMINKGFELTINSRNLEGKFIWDTNFNISFNKNKVDKFSLRPVYSDAMTSDHAKVAAVRNIAGRSLSGFWGYISDGVDPETGELMYRDLNGDGVVTSSDKAYIGDPNPDFTFGMTNSFSWKNFDLSIFIQGSYGNDIYNASRMETEGMFDGKNQSTKVLDRWRVPGQITSVPKAGFNMQNSNYFVEDGSYLRVKDISLSYNFRGQFLNKLGITRLQPYFTASNLLTWTNYSGMDPEVNQWGTGDDKDKGAVQGIDWGTYPHSKSFMFGVNIEF